MSKSLVETGTEPEFFNSVLVRIEPASAGTTRLWWGVLRRDNEVNVTHLQVVPTEYVPAIVGLLRSGVTGDFFQDALSRHPLPN